MPLYLLNHSKDFSTCQIYKKKKFNFTATWGRLSECGCVQKGEKCYLAVRSYFCVYLLLLVQCVCLSWMPLWILSGDVCMYVCLCMFFVWVQYVFCCRLSITACVCACLVRYSVNNDVHARVFSSSCVCMQRKWMESSLSKQTGCKCDLFREGMKDLQLQLLLHGC